MGEIEDILAKIEICKHIIGTERDKLRVIYDELDSLLDRLDRGIQDLENGKKLIENGLDTLSEQL
jgi:hypothetical protein